MDPEDAVDYAGGVSGKDTRELAAISSLFTILPGSHS